MKLEICKPNASAAGFLVALSACSSFGASADGARLERMQASPNYKDGVFFNVLTAEMGSAWELLKGALGGDEVRSPEQPLPVQTRTRADFATPPEAGLRITWLGHSSLLLELDGFVVLTDPVWGERASPFSWVGPKRFFAPPLPLDELPALDAIVLSHDHYDHLDEPTIRALADKDVVFYVPLGVGAHLSHWGIPETRIKELDWWQEAEPKPGLLLAATPARHFSGRGLIDRDETLWASWVVKGPTHRLFFSGDTGMFPEFNDIGRRYGPFDVTMIESGAYNPLWADVHLGPEQAVQAHIMLQGRLFLPIHWGTFNLAYHAWTEPGERSLAAAAERGVELALPRPGESVIPGTSVPSARWWPADVAWETAAQRPVVSSRLGP